MSSFNYARVIIFMKATELQTHKNEILSTVFRWDHYNSPFCPEDDANYSCVHI